MAVDGKAPTNCGICHLWYNNIQPLQINSLFWINWDFLLAQM
jgi:hypothetical protein